MPDDFDVTVVVAGRRFRLHEERLRNASHYFEVMFSSSSWRECTTRLVELHDMDAETAHRVFQYCETGHLELPGDNCIDLLAVSDRLQVDCLKKLLEDHLLEELDYIEKVPHLFGIAEQCNCAKLRDACVKLATWRFPEIVDLISSEHFHIVHLLVSKEFLHSDEDLVLKAVTSVARGRNINEVEKLVNQLFVENISRPIDGGLGSILPSLGRVEPLGRKQRLGYRKDANTVAFISEARVLYAWDRGRSRLQRITQLPVHTMGFAIVRYRQYLYLMGGEGHVGRGDWNMNVHRYDCLKNEWKNQGTMDVQRRSCQAVLTDDGQIALFHGYGRYRVELETVSVFDTASQRWTRSRYLKDRPAPGPFCTTIVFVAGYFYHFVSTAIVYRFTSNRIDAGSADVLRIDETAPPSIITYVSAIDYCRFLVVTTEQRIILWYPEKVSAQPVQLIPEKFKLHRCTMIDRSLYSVNLEESVMSELLLDTATNTLRVVAEHPLFDGSQNKKLSIYTTGSVPYNDGSTLVPTKC